MENAAETIPFTNLEYSINKVQMYSVNYSLEVCFREREHYFIDKKPVYIGGQKCQPPAPATGQLHHPSFSPATTPFIRNFVS